MKSIKQKLYGLVVSFVVGIFLACGYWTAANIIEVSGVSSIHKSVNDGAGHRISTPDGSLSFWEPSQNAKAAGLVYNSFLDDVFAGNIVKTDTIKCMLTTSAYTENKDTHTRRSDVTNEVTGTGYTAGGAATTFTVTKDTTNDRITITVGAQTYPSSTITARKQVCYKSRGGLATADELLLVNDFVTDAVSIAGTLTVSASVFHINVPTAP